MTQAPEYFRQLLAQMFSLDDVVPWGRSFDEYRRMFALSEGDLTGKIIGCADGPASFNAEVTRRGGRVIFCDPLYRFGRTEIEQRIVATCPQILEQTRQNADAFVWGGDIFSIEQLAHARMAAMRVFLNDYDAGKARGRYVCGE